MNKELNKLFNQEIFHRIKEFCNIILEFNNENEINEWVGGHKNKLPLIIKIGDFSENITSRKLKYQCRQYLKIADDFIHKGCEILDFGNLIAEGTKQNEEVLSDLLFHFEVTRVPRLKDGVPFCFSSFKNNIKHDCMDTPFFNAFNNGLLDQVMIETIFVCNKRIGEVADQAKFRLQNKWTKLIKLISKSASRNASRINSRPIKIGLRRITEETAPFNLDDESMRDSNTNSIFKFFALVIELKKQIQSNLSLILGSTNQKASELTGLDSRNTSFAKFTMEISKLNEREEFDRLRNSDPYFRNIESQNKLLRLVKNSSGCLFLTKLFLEITGPALFKNNLRITVTECIFKPISDRSMEVGGRQYSKNKIREIADIYLYLFNNAIEELKKQSESVSDNENWDSVREKVLKKNIRDPN